MELDRAPGRFSLRLADGAVVVARDDVGNAGAEIHVVPRERRRFARAGAVPAQEEHEGMEGGMLAPDELPLERAAGEPGGDLVPLLGREGIGGRRGVVMAREAAERMTEDEGRPHG